MRLPIFEYREHRLPSGIVVPVSALHHPPPFRSKQFVIAAESRGIRSKIFSVFFFRELGYFVHLGYFSPSHALVGRYVLNAPPGGSASIDLTEGGKLSVLGFKYSQHASGQAHFSLSGRVPPEVKTMTTPPAEKIGHVFTVNFGGIHSFARTDAKDAKPASRERTVLTFQFNEPKHPPGKIIAWWYPTKMVQVSSLGEGNPWEPKQLVFPTQDGRQLPGFMIAPPEEWDWSDHALVLTVDPILKPSSALESFLLFQGAVAVERDEDGNDIGESFVAASITDRTADLQEMIAQHGTLDLPINDSAA